jgi:hypothetical protein
MFLLFLACSSPCDEAQVRLDGSCLDYAAAEPVQGAQIPLANGLTWQWQITETVDTSHDVQVYDVDLFELEEELAQELLADGRVLICYFSAGSFEPWTDDAGLFSEEVVGRRLDGWPDERWLDTTRSSVRELMEGRLDLARDKGCQGVEPDNVTAFSNRSGFGITALEQLDYNRFLADAAHERDLAVALKNDVDQVPELVDWFDFTVNEECADYSECGTLRPFVDADKAVLHAEYVDEWADAASKAEQVCGAEPGLSTIVKTWDLGPELLACP